MPIFFMRHSNNIKIEIKRIVKSVLNAGSCSENTRRIAESAFIRPVDYMRCAEFDAIIRLMNLSPGDKILDISSPQWLSIYLAKSNPDISFIYTNILDSELEPFAEISELAGVANIQYQKCDTRELPFPDQSFDGILSVSVIEHIFPEIGGDVTALKEIHRVIRPGGKVWITVPCKQTANTIYLDCNVYEREKAVDLNFFAREYDMPSFKALIAKANFEADEILRIEERVGLLAVDYWEWGPGKRYPLWSTLLDQRTKFELLAGISFDSFLARRNLTITKEPHDRLVNVAACLSPSPL
jgi:ubiquinone/menaquinone biosynthesis C-methylase UbiE